jgi:hypothetical protein
MVGVCRVTDEIREFVFYLPWRATFHEQKKALKEYDAGYQCAGDLVVMSEAVLNWSGFFPYINNGGDIGR